MLKRIVSIIAALALTASMTATALASPSADNADKAETLTSDTDSNDSIDAPIFPFYPLFPWFTVHVESVKLDKSEATMTRIGETLQLTASVNPEKASNKSILFRSSDDKVVTVDPNGKVTAVGNGKASVKAVSAENEDKYALCEITVETAGSSGSIDIKDGPIRFTEIGETSALNVTVSPSDAGCGELRFSSSDENVASVDGNGTVTAIGDGTAVITVESVESGNKAEVEIIVDTIVHVTGIEIDVSELKFESAGEEAMINAAVTPEQAADKTVIFESSDEKVAVVDVDGKVTAVADGVAEIRVSSKDNPELFVVCKVEVAIKIPVAEFTVAPERMILAAAGKGQRIEALVLPENASDKNISYTSSDEKVAKVDNEGLVTAAAPGRAVITAVCGGITREVNVFVGSDAGRIRFAGKDRYETASQISSMTFEKAENVVIACGDNFPDALSAAPLAYALDAPILLASDDSLSPSIKDEINRLGAENAYIIGGEAAVSLAIEQELSRELAVKRIYGNNRYETAAAVAEELARISGSPSEIFLSSGTNYPDALSISGIAAMKGSPIVFWDGSGNTDDEAVEGFLSDHKAASAVIIGGHAAVPKDTEYKIVKLGIKNVDRLGGTDRYATMLKINEKFSEMFTGREACAATGNNYPDALAGAVFAAKNKMPVILVPQTVGELSKALIEFTSENRYSGFFIFGGENAVEENVIDTISVDSSAAKDEPGGEDEEPEPPVYIDEEIFPLG